MVTLKTEEEIRLLKEGGRILAKILKALARACRPGISGYELDQMAERLVLENGAEPAFKGYKPHYSRRAFPATLCVSKNSVVVHGLPRRDLILRNGDIVSLDLGIIYKKLFTDGAVTLGVGRISPVAKKLIKTSEKALYHGIAAARVGNTVGDIGFAIEQYVKKKGLWVIRELVGHGVGYKIHEDPNVPNYGSAKTGPLLKPGMVLAIEPMVSVGNKGVLEVQNGSFVTRDNSLAAHFEHTIVITNKKPIILTL